MTNNKKKNNVTILVIIAILTLICYIATYSINQYTIVSPYYVIIPAILPGSASGLLMLPIFRRITHKHNAVLNIICGAIFSTGLLLAAFYILNFALSDSNTHHTEGAVVERKYSKTRHHIKRITRKRYAMGEAYNMYYADIRFFNGKTNSIIIPQKRYVRIHTGDTISIPVERGLFNIPVIKTHTAFTDIPRANMY